MDDVTRALAEKNKIIDALASALQKAYTALEDVQYITPEDLDDINVLAEEACEEIVQELVSRSVPRDYIPG